MSAETPVAASPDAALPVAQTRALLLTDVVGSTQLSEALGDAAMAAVWAAHDRVARDLLPPWRGREIDKTDGMLLLFEQAADALQYALAYHRALAVLPVPLQARAGLHVGPVILRENTPEDIARGGKPLEVDGMAKPTAARVMSLARGGQTLLTPQAHEAVAPALHDAALHSASHGHWVLKGVSEPVELFEVGPDAQAFAAPPDADKAYRVVKVAGRWLPVRKVPNNLPEPANAFIGRERELRELKGLLGQARLVTLLGMGGLGKTRLSLQAAHELLAEYPDGVWFLDLAPLRDASLVLAEAAQVIGVREEPGQPLLKSLCQQLRDQRVLLVVDNCEHLIQPAAAFVHALLQSAPKVTCVASSRIPLRVPGERTYPIQPLPVPSASDGLDVLARSTAVLLFVGRAQEQRPDFELTQAEAPAVAELVARLEGIPLALELAAARLRSMTVTEINRRLKNRFKLLTGGSRTRDERQQTLRGLVDWSYELLEPAERVVLQRLAVFAGGFDLAAAETVCADEEDVERDDVLDLLASLVDKSLVTMEQREGEGRFRTLETIREYAAEKLAEGDDAAAAAARHCVHFFELAKQGREGMAGPRQGHWLDRLELERDNLRAAMTAARSGGSSVDPLIAVKMAVALQNFWIMRGGAAEGRALVQEMLAHPAVLALPMAQAHALYVGATLAWAQGELDEALAMLRACLALRRGLNATRDIAATLSTMTVTLLASGDTTSARACGAEAVILLRECGYRAGEAISMLQMGQVEAASGNVGSARDYLEEALAIATAIQHAETQGEAHLLLGDLAAEAGNEDEAARRYAASLALCSAAGDLRGQASAQGAQGRLDLLAGRLARASTSLRGALLAFERLDMRLAWVACLEDHAHLAQATGALDTACALASAAQQVRERAHLVRTPGQQARWQALLAALNASLGEDAFDAATSKALGWEPAEATRQALACHERVPPETAP